MKNEINGLRCANLKLTNENENLAVLLNEHNTVLQHVMEKYRNHVYYLYLIYYLIGNSTSTL